MPSRNRSIQTNYEDINYQKNESPKRKRNRRRRSRNRRRTTSIRSVNSLSANEYHGFQMRPRGESSASQYTHSNVSVHTNDQSVADNRSIRGFSRQQKSIRWDRDRLSREIWKFCLDNSQSPELLTRKCRLRDALHKILTTHFPNYEVELHIVGSTANGLANNKSDVDICLVLSEIGVKVAEEEEKSKDTNIMDKLMPSTVQEKKVDESSAEKTEVGIIVNYEETDPIDKSNVSSDSIASNVSNGGTDPSIPMLEMVKEVLKNYSFVTQMQIIAAKVPILKFIDRISGIEVTLNVNKLVSIRNTHLIHDYTKLDWRVKPLVMVIKAWANDHSINDAHNKSISSYSLVLMVIHYLQYSVEPPILPCLQQMHPNKYSPTSDIKSIKMSGRPIRWKSENESSLKELLIGFLDYYSYSFCYSKDAISIRLGQILPKHLVQRYKSEDNAFSHWKYLCIEEPFNRTNTARSVYDEVTFERILSVFRVSHYTIRRYSILDSIMTGKQYTNDYNVIDEYINAKDN